MPPKRKAPKLKVLVDENADALPSMTRSKRPRDPDDSENTSAPSRLHKRHALDFKSVNSTEGSLYLKREQHESSKASDTKSVKLAKHEDVRKIKLEHPLEEEPVPLSFHEAIESLLPKDNLIPFLPLLGEKADIQDLADEITTQDCWSPQLLSLFGPTPLETLKLSPPSTSAALSLAPHSASTLLAPLLTQGHFTSLTSVSLRSLTLHDDDLALLRLLPNLTHLDFCSTNITTHSLHHLITHRHSLQTLNIANNPLISDDARIILRPLTSLRSLFLRGTSFSLPALRLLALQDLPKSCRILSLPAAAIEHLNTRGEKYALDIPEGLMSEPDGDRIAGLTLPFLKRNLEWHQKANRELQVTGTKVELVARLKGVLWNRKGDEAILRVLGKAPVT